MKAIDAYCGGGPYIYVQCIALRRNMRQDKGLTLWYRPGVNLLAARVQS